MINDKKVLAIIPARKGSNGKIKKNIALLVGKPLIAYTIEAALVSKYIDKIIVSTDDEEIAKISLSYKAEIPFLRPKELAKDSSLVIDAVLHVLTFLENEKQSFDIVVLLQPTSPLRSASDIDSAIELLIKKEANSIISVNQTDHIPQLSNTLDENLTMREFFNNNCMNKNRQDYPKYYRINGAVYVSYIQFILSQKNFLDEKTFAYVMPRERSIDIDEEFDFVLCEFLIHSKETNTYNCF